MWRKGNLFAKGWWEYKLIQPLWRTAWRFLKKLGIKLSSDPTIPLLGIYLEKIINEKDTWTPMFTAALFAIARTQKQHGRPLTDEWMKKLWYIYIYICVYIYIYTHTQWNITQL